MGLYYDQNMRSFAQAERDYLTPPEPRGSRCPVCGAVNCETVYLTISTHDPLGCDECIEIVEFDAPRLCDCGEQHYRMYTRGTMPLGCPSCICATDAYEFTDEQHQEAEDYYLTAEYSEGRFWAEGEEW